MEKVHITKTTLITLNDKQKAFLTEYLQNRMEKYNESYTFTFNPQNNLDDVKLRTVAKDIIENEGHILFKGTPEQLCSIYRGENEDESLYNCYPTNSLNMDDTLSLATIISLGDKDLGNADFRLELKDNGVFGNNYIHHDAMDYRLYLSHYESVGQYNYNNPVILIETSYYGNVYTYLDGTKFIIID